MFEVNDVVQFNENHRQCPALGVVDEVKKIKDDTRYMIAVPIPDKGTAYIYVLESDNNIEKIGKAVIVYGEDENDETEN